MLYRGKVRIGSPFCISWYNVLAMKDILLNNKKKFIKGSLAVAFIIVAIVLVFALSDRREENVLGESFQESLNFSATSTKELIDHNFEIQAVNNNEVRSLTTDDSVGKTAKDTGRDEQSTEESKKSVQAQGLSIAANTLVIPKLNINTKVIEGIDGEEAIHEGAWLYPSSYEGNGEKILLGHRRFWGADDPRSFWNLDHLGDGDLIHYADAKGVVYTYEVKAVSVRNAGDLAILKASKENMIKVISCSTADGSAGSSEKRIVVIATQI